MSVRAARIVAATALLLAAAACERERSAPPPPADAAPLPKTIVAATDGEDPYAGVTAMAEREALLGLLNKRNGLVRDIRLKPGESIRVGRAIVRLRACERTAQWESPQETGAFVQLIVLDHGSDAWRRVFSGWLFKDRPDRNVVQHPIYDVFVKSCTMRWPGEVEVGGEEPAPAEGAPSRRSSAPQSPSAPASSASTPAASDSAPATPASAPTTEGNAPATAG